MTPVCGGQPLFLFRFFGYLQKFCSFQPLTSIFFVQWYFAGLVICRKLLNFNWLKSEINLLTHHDTLLDSLEWLSKSRLKNPIRPHSEQHILRHFHYKTKQKLCKFEALSRPDYKSNVIKTVHRRSNFSKKNFCKTDSNVLLTT